MNNTAPGVELDEVDQYPWRLSPTGLFSPRIFLPHSGTDPITLKPFANIGTRPAKSGPIGRVRNPILRDNEREPIRQLAT